MMPVRSLGTLLLSHIAFTAAFAVVGIAGSFLVYATLLLVIRQDLEVLHQSLQSSHAFHNYHGAFAVLVAGIVAGCLASALSPRQPILHAALSSIGFFAIAAYALVHDVFSSTGLRAFTDMQL